MAARLDDGSAADLIEAAHHNTLRQVEALLASRFPAAPVPDRIRPLIGEAPAAQPSLQQSSGYRRSRASSEPVPGDCGSARGGLTGPLPHRAHRRPGPAGQAVTGQGTAPARRARRQPPHRREAEPSPAPVLAAPTRERLFPATRRVLASLSPRDQRPSRRQRREPQVRGLSTDARRSRRRRRSSRPPLASASFRRRVAFSHRFRPAISVRRVDSAASARSGGVSTDARRSRRRRRSSRPPHASASFWRRVAFSHRSSPREQRSSR